MAVSGSSLHHFVHGRRHGGVSIVSGGMAQCRFLHTNPPFLRPWGPTWQIFIVTSSSKRSIDCYKDPVTTNVPLHLAKIAGSYLWDESVYAVKAQTSLAQLSRFRSSLVTTAHEHQCCRFQSYAKTVPSRMKLTSEIDKAWTTFLGSTTTDHVITACDVWL